MDNKINIQQRHGDKYISGGGGGGGSLSCKNEKRNQINYYRIIYDPISVDMSHVRIWDANTANMHMALFNEKVSINETTKLHI